MTLVGNGRKREKRCKPRGVCLWAPFADKNWKLVSHHGSNHITHNHQIIRIINKNCLGIVKYPSWLRTFEIWPFSTHPISPLLAASLSEELQDVPETEIESNWDQVVDKYVLPPAESLLSLTIRPKTAASITWTSSLTSSEASMLTGTLFSPSISKPLKISFTPQV